MDAHEGDRVEIHIYDLDEGAYEVETDKMVERPKD